ncbi:MAG: DUF1552 domain-containing protein [Myxococcota bacterium]
MKAFSRRHFLRGAGGAVLALPFLPSLAPRGADAQEGSLPCFVGVASIYGTFRRNWEVDMAGETQIGPQMWRRPLTEISGPISPTLGTDFDGLRAKMNVYTGLDGTSVGGHNLCFPFSGSTHSGGSDARDTQPFFPYSLDTLLERSSFYGDAPPPMPVLRSAPAYRGEALGNISWWTDESGSVSLPYERSDATLASTVFTEGEPVVDRNGVRLRAMDRVLEDYRRVAAHPRLSGADRSRLEHYANLVSELSARLERTQVVSCSNPGLLSTEDEPLSVVYRNHIDIMVAALACGATRVGMLWIPDHDESDSSQSDFHGWSHGLDRGNDGGTDAASEASMLAANRWIAGRVSELLHKMDGIEGAAGETLLDRSAVLWSNELGGAQHHTNIGTPVVVAGGAGGRLRTGFSYDFRARPRRLWANRNDFPPMGRPYNEVLVGLLTAMGLERSEWELAGAGFGDYQGLEARYTNGAYEEFIASRGAALPELLA